MLNRRTPRRHAGKTLGAALLFIAAVLPPWLAPPVSRADDDHHDERHEEEYESKFYGTVDALPPDLVGVWIVNGREIVVSRHTRIKDKHGRPEPGAFVEVEGSNRGTAFIASEVKIKRARQH